MNISNQFLSETDTQTVNQILVENLEIAPEQITPEAKIYEDLGADSLSMIEIGMAAEDRFDLVIPDEAMESIVTVSDLYEAVAKYLPRPR